MNFHTPQLVRSLPFIWLRPEKDTLLSGASPYRPLWEATTPGCGLKVREEFLCMVVTSTSFSVYTSDAIIIIESEIFTIM